jgi:CHAD domain-containing protein
MRCPTAASGTSPSRGAPSADDPAALHRLRIFVKRLKYTMEPFRPVLPPLEGPYQTVSDVQEALGLAHDFDVLRDFVAHHAQDEGADGTTPHRPALQVVDRRRADLYGAARTQLIPLTEETWYRALLDAID